MNPNIHPNPHTQRLVSAVNRLRAKLPAYPRTPTQVKLDHVLMNVEEAIVHQTMLAFDLEALLSDLEDIKSDSDDPFEW